MNYTAEDYEYLEGKRFSNGYCLKLKNNILYTRINTLLDLTKEKTVLHIGCCDHINLIDSKIANNNWLHGELLKVCEKVIGIDIDEEAVNYIKQKGINDVYYNNVLTDDPIEISEKYDYILLAEIIEHLDNPQEFLITLKSKYKNLANKLIITAPNAFSAINFKNSKLLKECINSDHRFWFTPYTISKILVKSGIKPVEILFADDNIGLVSRLINKICRILRLTPRRLRPALKHSVMGGTIIIIGEI